LVKIDRKEIIVSKITAFTSLGLKGTIQCLLPCRASQNPRTK